MLKILIATDGSEHSAHAAEHAIRLAREASGSEAVLLNVEPSPIDWQTHRIEQDVVVAHLRQHGAETCESARKLLEDAGIPFSVVVQLGEPAQTIVQQAQTNGCDLIVMGTRGHGAIPGLALGSVALKVVHLSELPVTLVK
jgi:nucleotide-binding universal stress UspA family protein